MKTPNEYLLCVKIGKCSVYALAGCDLGPQGCLAWAEALFREAGFDTQKMYTRWGEDVTKQKNFKGYSPVFKVIKP